MRARIGGIQIEFCFYSKVIISCSFINVFNIKVTISMNKTLVSIITPVYNAEEYLPDFLDSLKKQIFKDFEVIFVDDGSTDNSLKLLKEFEESNKNTTILTQRRKYAGIARNLGLTKAVGEYVIFLDADDIAEPDLISRAIVAAKNFKTDIVVFGVYAFNSKQGIQGRVKLPWTSNVKLIPPETPFNFSSSKGHIFKITTPAPSGATHEFIC